MNIFSRLKDGLSKTRSQIGSIVGVSPTFEEGFFDSLEDALISADVGVDFTGRTIEQLRLELKERSITRTADVFAVLKEMLVMNLPPESPKPGKSKPWIILVVGVNGVGKTTTIGKIANEYRLQDKKVLPGAADTFRAGAIEQLHIWAQRTGSNSLRSTKARTRRPWRMTRLRPRKTADATWRSSTPPDGCTTKSIS